MSRTTLDIDQTVLEKLRRRGIEERKSMGQVASELLASALEEGRERSSSSSLSWISDELGTPRVDLEDKEALRKMLEG